MIKLLLLMVLANASVPTSVVKYKEAFVDESNTVINMSHFDNIEIKIDYLSYSLGGKDKQIGLCQRKFFEKSVITFDKKWWNSITDLERKSLAFHEFGHCVCGLNHSVYLKVLFFIKPFPDNCPDDLMNPYDINYSCLKTHWDEYSKNLFIKCRSRL